MYLNEYCCNQVFTNYKQLRAIRAHFMRPVSRPVLRSGPQFFNFGLRDGPGLKGTLNFGLRDGPGLIRFEKLAYEPGRA